MVDLSVFSINGVKVNRPAHLSYEHACWLGAVVVAVLDSPDALDRLVAAFPAVFSPFKDAVMHAPSRLPSPPSSISRDAILAARAAFERRIEALAADDTPVDSSMSDSSSDRGDVVIAYGVTFHQVDALPDEWVRGVQLAIRAGGALVITKLSGGADHTSAVGEVFAQVREYARTNNAEVVGGRLPLRGGQRMAEPDVCLFMTVPGRPTKVTIALFEVEFASKSCPEIIAMADAYFAEMDTLQRVVVFKFFPPLRPRGAHRPVVRPVFPDADLTELSVPALAIVFERIPNAAPGNGRRLRVAKMRSFGNVRVHSIALDAFSRPRNASPLEPFRDAHAHAMPVPTTVLPDHFNIADLRAELAHARRASTLVFDVAMDAPWPAIPVDLVMVFVAAMNGWNIRFQAYAQGGAGAVTATAPAATPVGAAGPARGQA